MSKTFFYFLVFFSPIICFAQSPNFVQSDTSHSAIPKKPQIITTNDGGVFIGIITDMNDREVTVITKDKGRVIIPKYAIKKIEPVSDENYESGNYVGGDNFADKYIVANSALPMEKQKWDINALYYFLWSANYSFNEHFSIGMTGIYFLPLMLNSKINIKIGRQTYFGTELHIGDFWFEPGYYFGHANLKLTTGTKQNNFTMSVGTAGILNNYYSSYGNPKNTYTYIYTANVGGMKRIGNNIALTGELWALFSITNNNPIYVGGVGFKTLKSAKHSFTFALMGVAYPKQQRYYTGTYPYSYSYRNTYGLIPFPVITYHLKL